MKKYRPTQKKAIWFKPSKPKKSERDLYHKEVAVWKKTHPCAVCGAKKVDNHHSRGRHGTLLRDQRFWIPLCRFHHTVVHDNISLARISEVTVDGRTLPLMCAEGEWNREVQ
jgi:hypothetical protein